MCQCLCLVVKIADTCALRKYISYSLFISFFDALNCYLINKPAGWMDRFENSMSLLHKQESNRQAERDHSNELRSTLLHRMQLFSNEMQIFMSVPAHIFQYKTSEFNFMFI